MMISLIDMVMMMMMMQMMLMMFVMVTVMVMVMAAIATGGCWWRVSGGGWPRMVMWMLLVGNY